MESDIIFHNNFFTQRLFNMRLCNIRVFIEIQIAKSFFRIDISTYRQKKLKIEKCSI